VAQQLAVHLVGRTAELGVLEDALAGLREGRPAAIEIVGEPGIGKTRLLAELAERSDAMGFLVLTGSASELERDLPFGVFGDALDDYVLGLDPRKLELLGEDIRAELAHVFPSFSGSAADLTPILQDERFRLHRAVRELLEWLAESKPLVLILDDFHWADSGATELLGALLRRPPDAGVLIAFAVRPRQVAGRLAAAVERARRAGVLTSIELGALSPDEARELLLDTVDGPTAATLFDESGGNPFYLEQLARSLGHGAASGASTVSLLGVDVPPAVAASLSEELALLSSSARRVLEGAAVAGDPFEPELAAAGAAVSETDAIGALDELLRLDLVRTTDVPRRFRFRHPLVRRAVYEATPGGWRLTAHERCADALALRGASAEARAHHVEQAGRYGDKAAIAVLREAGEALAQRTPAGAARWFSAALRLLPETAGHKERIELLTALAGAQAATGRFVEARSALLEGIDLLPEDATTERVKLVVSCAGIEQILGRHVEARARLEGAFERLDDSTSPDAVALQLSLALDSYYRLRQDDWLATIERSIELATAIDNRPLQAAAYAYGAVLSAFASDTSRESDFASKAAAIVDRMTDDEAAVRLDALVHLGGAEAYSERFEDSIAHLDRARSIARATGQGALLPTLVPAMWTSLWMLGRLPETTELLEGAVEGARLVGSRQTLALHLLNLGLAAAFRGDTVSGLLASGESVDIADSLEYSFVTPWSHMSLGVVYMESGNHARASELLLTAGGDEEMSSIPGVWRGLTLEWVTRCHLALGRCSDAARSAAAAAGIAAGTSLRLATAWAERAAAAVALDDGDPSTAAERALASAAAAEEVGARLEAALGRLIAGRAFAQGGARARAAEGLERAAAELAACGALRYREAAEHELRKLGRRSQRTPRGRSEGIGLDALTERELEVARLVVERKTNPEIAAELFLSLKTVETHMRNIFGKLGVSSRVDVARALESADARRGAR
jgi:ATP/maltotriose-dependent transcriptional regulator MalT